MNLDSALLFLMGQILMGCNLGTWCVESRTMSSRLSYPSCVCFYSLWIAILLVVVCLGTSLTCATVAANGCNEWHLCFFLSSILNAKVLVSSKTM
jgi:hypothetical protein